MIQAVADTHAVIWHLYDDERLSEKARKAIEQAAKQGDQIGLSAITLIEMVYLPRESVPYMPDRIIAATAQTIKVPIISRDRKIKVSGLKTIW